jgi:hypothetical protein
MSTFPAGLTLLGATLEALVDAWTPYTPTWTGSGGDPVVNDGTISGRYKRLGTTVHFTAQVTLGAGTTVGAGFYSFGIPVASSASAGEMMILAQFFDASAAGAAQYSMGIGQLGAGASNIIRIRMIGENNANATMVNWSATYPAVPAVSDVFNVSGTYEAAAV